LLAVAVAVLVILSTLLGQEQWVVVALAVLFTTHHLVYLLVQGIQ
jgi:hypothetical protein